MSIQYNQIISNIIIYILLVLILFFVAFFFEISVIEDEKIGIYECGFSPYGDSRIRFEVMYYYISILFLLFDVEITLLFPYVFISIEASFREVAFIGIFLLILLYGLFYELSKDIFQWGKKK